MNDLQLFMTLQHIDMLYDASGRIHVFFYKTEHTRRFQTLFCYRLHECVPHQYLVEDGRVMFGRNVDYSQVQHAHDCARNALNEEKEAIRRASDVYRQRRQKNQRTEDDALSE